MVWVTPLPASWMIAATCWIPVPEAPTIPKGPRLVMLESTRAAPLILATPQSGPMQKSPFSLASSFISLSSAKGTLLLNTQICFPAFKAFFASSSAQSPGTAMCTRLTSGCSFKAASVVSYSTDVSPPSLVSILRFTSVTAFSKASLLSASATTT